jgi:hypothetical protein
MSKYCVVIPEVHLAYLMIEAEDDKDAIAKVADGGGEEINCEYSHTLEDDECPWQVNKM